MRVIVIALPDPNAQQRDINFTSIAEASGVANSFMGDPFITSDIKVVQMVPEAVNTKNDGRNWYQIQFTRKMNLPNSLGRNMDFLVPFDLNAGLILDDDVNNPAKPWKFDATSKGDDTFVGDVEK